MSAIKANQWLNPDGTENYKCRAWVNFNGTGTVAIRAAGNVSSITDNGTGDYTVNFPNAMPDVNYAVAVSASNNLGTTDGLHVAGWRDKSTTTVRVNSFYPDSVSAGVVTVADDAVDVAIFR